MSALLALVIAFALGSIPWSLWVGRRYGLDLREHGSGNLGATNVYRVLGWKLGLGVLVLDVAKGAAAVAIARGLSTGGGIPTLGALAAVAGHMFTPLAGFRGGKGVATGLGVFLGLAPLAAFMAFLVWVGTMLLTGWVSVSSGLGSIVLPMFVVWTRDDLGPRYPWVLAFSIALTVLVLARHRSNWRRLASGTEQPIWEGRQETPDGGARPVGGPGPRPVSGAGREPARPGKPDPTPRPTPKPQPRPEPAPTPKPWPRPEPAPTPKPQPQPEPTPRPKPHPEPEPRPAPKPKPDPEPRPAPKPHPDPEPTPGPRPKAKEGRKRKAKAKRKAKRKTKRKTGSTGGEGAS